MRRASFVVLSAEVKHPVRSVGSRHRRAEYEVRHVSYSVRRAKSACAKPGLGTQVALPTEQKVIVLCISRPQPRAKVQVLRRAAAERCS